MGQANYLLVRDDNGRPMSLWLKHGTIETKVLPVFSTEDKAKQFIDDANFGVEHPPVRHIRSYSSVEFDTILGTVLRRGIVHFWRDPEYDQVERGDDSELVHILRYFATPQGQSD